MHEELGIVKNVGYGNRDVGHPVLWFDVQMLSYSCLIVMEGEEADNTIKSSKCYDVRQLNNKACIMETNEEDKKSKFVRWLE